MTSGRSIILRIPVGLLLAALTATSASAQQAQGGNQQKRSGGDQTTSGRQTGGSQAGTRNQSDKVDLDDVSRHPEKYVGKTVSVEGETVDVLGPHLFVVDEPKWFHLRGGMLVIVPEPLAAIVRRDAPVRVTGTVDKVVLAEARRKWSFINDPRIQVDLFEKPVLVAKEVTTVAPAIVSLIVDSSRPVGTSGSTNGSPITDIGQIARANDSSLVGRHVEVSGTVVRSERDGFWLRTSSGGEEIFVVPATKTQVRAGQSVSVQGTLLETPRRDKQRASGGKDQTIYVYADRVTPK